MRRVLALALALASCRDFDQRLAQCIDSGQCTDGTGNPTPKLVFDATPAELDFFAVQVGATKSATATFRNDGAAATTALTTELAPGPFTRGPDGCAGVTLTAGATCDVTVTFAPTAPGEQLATLTVRAASGGTVTVTLKGSGQAPASLSLQPNQVDFAPRTVNTTSPAARVVVRNNGAVAATGLAVRLTGAGMASYALTGNTCTASLAAGAACELDVTFRPGAEGPAAAAALEVSAAGTPAVAAPLTGTGLPLSDLTVMPPQHTFGAVAIGRTARQTFTVRNGGAAATSVVSTMRLGASASHYSLALDTCAGAMLPPMGACSFDVVFAPTASGPLPVTVTAGATTGGTVSVDLAGTGIAPARLVLSPLDGGFGTLDAGQVLGRSYTVVNTGEEPSEPVGLVLTAPVSFSLDGGTCLGARLGNDAGCNFSLRYAPSGLETASGTLAVGADAGGVTVLGLQGQGRIAYRLTITQYLQRSGTIFVPGYPPCETLSLPLQCTYEVPPGTVLNLTSSTPHPGWAMTWSPPCGTSPTCQVTMDQDRQVFAGFGGNTFAFVTSERFSPTFGGVDGGDAICQNVAVDAGLPGTYRAFLSDRDAGIRAYERLPPFRGWVRTDGTWLTGHRQELQRPVRLFSQLATTERRTVLPYDPNDYTFTGTQADGGASGFDCGGWRDFNAVGTAGVAHALDSQWTESFFLVSCVPGRLYCFETDVMTTVEQLQRQPPPDGGRLAFVTSTRRNGDSPITPDQHCAISAAAGGIPGTFRALVSFSGANDAHLRFRLDAGNWYRLDGARAFFSPYDLADAGRAGLPAPWLNNLADVPDGGQLAWSGAAGACSGWTSPASSGGVGDPRAITSSWWSAFGFARSCDAGQLSYCLQD
ncbi:MAG: choice-of-anchor D domain-containing protein [Myxococcaceae bacterium]|nr:choice-of-anchor D domain-containing protein [Myxococcaceae bacterium]